MELFEQLNADMAVNSPAWVTHWVNVMGLVLLLGIPFVIFRKEARWAWLFILIGIAGVLTLYHFHGYSRVLGLGHVVGWTPALIYLWSQRDNWEIGGTWFGKWALAATTIIAISLAFDYVDVARWLLGERH